MIQHELPTECDGMADDEADDAKCNASTRKGFVKTLLTSDDAANQGR